MEPVVRRWFAMDAEPASFPELPRPPARVDRYELIAEVAQGGMAIVYVARRWDTPGFDKLLALKILLPHLARERRFVDMFRDEIRIAARIQHPNVVQVFDVGEHGRLPYMVMEYLRGRSLAALIRRAATGGEVLPRGLVVSVLASMAEGLHGAHEARDADGSLLGVVHRDVSPQNVHVGFDGHVKVVDFGIAAARGRLTSTHSGEVKGKMGYMAPEQVHQDHPVDRRTDLWALGVVAWETFTGRRLFRADTDATTLWNVINAPIPPLSEVAPDVAAPVAACVMRCLEREPGRRPDSAAEVAAILGPVAYAADGWRAPRVAEHVSALFQDEKTADDERLAAAQAQPSSSVVVADRPRIESERPTVTGVRTVGRSPARFVAPAVVVLVALGIGGWLLLRTEGGGDPAAQGPSVDAPAASEEAAAPAADRRVEIADPDPAMAAERDPAPAAADAGLATARRHDPDHRRRARRRAARRAAEGAAQRRGPDAPTRREAAATPPDRMGAEPANVLLDNPY